MMPRLLFLILTLGLPASQAHAIDQWGGTGPILSGTGNRFIHALAVSPDGGTVYAGAGSGTVFVYVHADTTPAAFAFADRTDVALSTLTTSDPLTVSGVNTTTAISVSGGEYRINNGTWTTADGTVANGDTVAVRHTSSGNHGVTVDTVLSIGGVSDTFSSTTWVPPAVVSGPTATGTGIETVTTSGGGPTCGFITAQFLPLSSVPVAPPSGVGFPHGLFDFTLGGCTPGATITLNIEYPGRLPAGTTYWKYGPTPTDASYHWYTIASTVSGRTVSFSIVDGGLGDDDLKPNGTLIDQGGPAQVAGEATPIPAMSMRGLGLLSLLLAACAVALMRRRA